MKAKFLILAMGLAMAACGGNKAANVAQEAEEAQATEIATIPVGSEWALIDYAGDSAMCVMGEDEDYELKFYDLDGQKYFTLTTDCNAISGAYELVGDSIMIGEMASTEMACPSEKVENDMKQILPRIDTYAITPDSVLMLRSDMRTMARFKQK